MTLCSIAVNNRPSSYVTSGPQFCAFASRGADGRNTSRPAAITVGYYAALVLFRPCLPLAPAHLLRTCRQRTLTPQKLGAQPVAVLSLPNLSLFFVRPTLWTKLYVWKSSPLRPRRRTFATLFAAPTAHKDLANEGSLHQRSRHRFVRVIRFVEMSNAMPHAAMQPR